MELKMWFFGTILFALSASEECPNLILQPINPEHLEGQWFDAKKTPTSSAEEGNGCDFENFRFLGGLNWKLIVNNSLLVNERYLSTITRLRRPDSLIETNFGAFVMENPSHDNQNEIPNLFILYLDSQVALFYFCQSLEDDREEMALILSRDQNPDPTRVAEMELKLASFGIFVDMVDVRRDNCPIIGEEDRMKHLRLLFRELKVRRHGKISASKIKNGDKRSDWRHY